MLAVVPVAFVSQERETTKRGTRSGSYPRRTASGSAAYVEAQTSARNRHIYLNHAGLMRFQRWGLGQYEVDTEPPAASSRDQYRHFARILYRCTTASLNRG